MIYYNKLSIGMGPMTTAIDKNGAIKGLWFDGQTYYPQLKGDEQWMTQGHMPEPVDKTYKALFKQLRAYEVGDLKTFDLPLAPEGTVFRQVIWQLLLEIPYGQTSTYGHLAKEAARIMGKSSMSAQAVGGAVGHNPISILIPCHRVIGQGGQLTGYAGGLDKKSGLLKIEGVL